MQGPRRVRPFAPLASPEPDPHEQRAEYPASLREKLTGAHLTLQPQYRRKPPYRTGEDGTATMSFSDDIGVEARNWARCFGMDVRKCIIRSHLHRCGPTCWKYTKDDVPQHCEVCRLGFYHEYETAVYHHPGGKHPAGSDVCRRCRKGKDLVLPEGSWIEYGPSQEEVLNPPGQRLVFGERSAGWLRSLAASLQSVWQSWSHRRGEVSSVPREHESCGPGVPAVQF